MDLQGAVDNFESAVKHCANIIEVHRGYGGGGMGRRYLEPSLDRAVVVLAVAAWQAAVQDMTTAILDTAAPSTKNRPKRARYYARVGNVTTAIKSFATPNAQNTVRLMHSAGFDPKPLWVWASPGGRGRPFQHWTPAMASARLNEWLDVRHAIAHGHEELPVVDALESVRLDGLASNPSIRLVDAEQCVAFLRRLVRLTAAGVAVHLGVSVSFT